MTEFEYHHAGNSEAKQKEALAWLFTNTAGLATDGVLSGLSVTASGTPDINVQIAAGAGVVQAATLDGASLMVNDSPKTLAVLTGADVMGGLPRRDIIAFDQATGTIRNLKGTANASPVDPTVPTSCLPLARLRHAASATTIPSSVIDDLRTFTSLAGIPKVQSGTATLTGDGTNQRFQDVTFPTAFTSTPIIMLQNLTGMTTSGTTQSVWPSVETSTGFRCNGIRNNTTTMSVRWFAILP